MTIAVPDGFKSESGTPTSAQDSAAAAWRTRRGAVAAALVAATLYLGGSRLPPPFAANVFANGAVLAAAATAAWASWRRFRFTPQPVWGFLAAYCAAWAVGEGIWTYYEVVMDRPAPFPSWADAGYLGAVPFAIAAAAQLPRRPARRVLVLLDGLLVALALFVVAWAFVMGPLHRDGGTWFEVWLGIAYPAADVAVIAVAVIALPHVPASWHRPARYVLGGLIAIAAADTGFAYLAVADRYATGSVIDLGWLVGFGLIAVGAVATPANDIDETDRIAVEQSSVRWPALVLPHSLLVLALLTFGWVQVRRGSVEATLVYTGLALVAVLVIRHVVTLVESERRASVLERQARFDGLTGLWNREALRRHLDGELRKGTSVGVLFIDVDDFKQVNDVLGHAGGDAALCDVAGRLRRCTRRTDRLARVGGDEFALAVSDVEAPAGAVSVALGIAEEMAGPVEVGAATRKVSVSIGIAMADAQADADTLLRNADFAMYTAKRKGKNRYELFEPELRADAVERIELTAALGHAIEREELVLHYQPSIDLRSGQVVGAEALIRWAHPTRGLLRPAEFIEVAESSVHLHAMGRWVLQEACAFATALRGAGDVADDFRISVNVAAGQLFEPSFLDALSHTLTTTALPADALVLELTESSLIDTNAALPILSAIRATGVQIAIDDFGTGYSSLSYLDRMPVDIIKIDRSFVAEIDRGVEKQAMARAIVVLAGALRLHTVAEGIEHISQAQELKRLGCCEAQGYYFSQPLPEDRFLARIRMGDWYGEHTAATPA